MDEASQTFDRIHQNATKSSSGITAAFGNIGGGIRSAISGVALFDLAMRGLDRLVEPLHAIYDAFSRWQDVTAQTNAVIRSTGGAAGVTSEQVLGLAESLEQSTTFSREQVGAATDILLTFTNIGGSILPQTTRAVLDFATAMHLDANQAALQIGKALQDPITGMTTLRREGVQFTQSQQDMLKQLIETGHGAEAQTMILKELAREFGGSAAAAAVTFGGQLKQLKNEVLSGLADELQEHVMPTLLRFSSWVRDTAVPAVREFAQVEILPRLQALGALMQAEVLPRLQAFGDFLRDRVLPVLKEFADWIETKVIPALQNFWAGDVLPKLQEFAAFMQGQGVQSLKDFASWLDDHAKPALAAFVQYIADHKEILAALTIAILAATVAWGLYTAAQIIASAASAAFPAVGVVISLTAITLGVIELVKHWDEVRRFWEDQKGWIIALLVPLGLLPAAFVATAAVIEEFVKRWDDIKSAATDAISWVQQKWQELTAWLGQKKDDLVSALEGPYKTVASEIDQLWTAIGQPIMDGVTRLMTWLAANLKIKDLIEGPLRDLANDVGALWNAIGQKVQDALNNLPGPVKWALGKIGLPLGGSGPTGQAALDAQHQASGFAASLADPSRGDVLTPEQMAAGLAAAGMPVGDIPTMVAILLAENGGRTTGLSSAGAAGFGQLMPGFAGISEANRLGNSPADLQAQFGAILAGYSQPGYGGPGFGPWDPFSYVVGPMGNEVFVGPGQGSFQTYLPQGQAAVAALLGGSSPLGTVGFGNPAGTFGGVGSPPSPATPGSAGPPAFSGAGAGDFNTGKEKASDKPLDPQQTAHDLATAQAQIDSVTQQLTNLQKGVSDAVVRITPAMLAADSDAYAKALPQAQGYFQALQDAETKLRADLSGGAAKSVIDADVQSVDAAKTAWDDYFKGADGALKQFSADQKTYNQQQQQDAQDLLTAQKAAEDARTKLAEVTAGQLKVRATDVTVAMLAEDRTQAGSAQQAALDRLGALQAANATLLKDLHDQVSPTILQADKDAVASAQDAAKATYTAWHDAESRLESETKARHDALVTQWTDFGNAMMVALKNLHQQQIDGIAAHIATIKQLDQEASTATVQRWHDETTRYVQELDNRTKAQTEALSKQETDQIASLSASNARAVAALYVKDGKTITATMAELDPSVMAQRVQQEGELLATVSQKSGDARKQLQVQYDAMLEEDLNARLQKEIKGVQASVTLQKQALADQTTREKQGIQDDLTNRTQAEQAYEKQHQTDLDNRLTKDKKYYADQMTQASLAAQARLLIEQGNQRDIVRLLASYDPEWKAQGQSFGEQMVDGLKASGLEDYLRGLFGTLPGGTGPGGSRFGEAGAATPGLRPGGLSAGSGPHPLVLVMDGHVVGELVGARQAQSQTALVPIAGGLGGGL